MRPARSALVRVWQPHAGPLGAAQAFLTDPPVVDKILKHLEVKAPGSQRGPPSADDEQELAS
jgi:hypothetical protein